MVVGRGWGFGLGGARTAKRMPVIGRRVDSGGLPGGAEVAAEKILVYAKKTAKTRKVAIDAYARDGLRFR